MTKLKIILNVEIPGTLNERFRKEVFNRKGMHKGNLTEAIQEAILLWIDNDTNTKISETPNKKDRHK